MTITNVQKFVSAIAGTFQLLSDAHFQLKHGRAVDNAVGAQLTAIGKLVGQPRDGVTDDELYRRYVRARIATNKSDGVIDDILSIADLVVYDDEVNHHLVNVGRAAYVLKIEDVILTDDIAGILISFLRRATAAGVRVTVEYYAALGDDVLTWGDSDEEVDGAGWGDVDDPDTGGVWADCIE